MLRLDTGNTLRWRWHVAKAASHCATSKAKAKGCQSLLSSTAQGVSMQLIEEVTFLPRHSQQMHREEDGAVHFWIIKENLQNQFTQSICWSDDRWKVCLAAGGGAKRRFQYCTDDSRIIIYFRTLQGHSGRNPIDPSLQDNVVIPSRFFQ